MFSGATSYVKSAFLVRENLGCLGMTTFSQEMSPYFDNVNTGEVPTSECHQMKGILTVFEM